MKSRENAENCSFWRDALEFRLLTEEQLDNCFANVPEDKRQPEKLDNRLARLAIHFGYLTLWQAQRVLTKRASTLVIDKYLLTNALGQGGMGRVYLAKDRRLNRLVALKVLNLDKLNHERALARFEREALVGGQLQQENLVRVYDVGVHQNAPFLVMEYIEGPTVAELIAQQGRLESAVAARIGRDVALGLQHLADKRLVHRDVNPRNILIDKEGRAKLTDLGLAIFEEQLSQVTNEGSTVGTFDYISPEQARHSRGVDIRSDIYSLGCTIYHMISGQPPFPEGNLAEKIYSHQLKEARPLEELVPGVVPELSSIVSRCLRKNPDERFASPRELADRLAALVTEESLKTTIGLNKSTPLDSGIESSSAAEREPSEKSRPESKGNAAALGEPDLKENQDLDGIDGSGALRLDLGGADSLELPFRTEIVRQKSMPSFSTEKTIKSRGALAAGILLMGSILIFFAIFRNSDMHDSDRSDLPLSSNNSQGIEKPSTTDDDSSDAVSEATERGIMVQFADGQRRGFDDIDVALRNVIGQSAEIEIEAREEPWVWKAADDRTIAGSRWKIRSRGSKRAYVILDVTEAKSGLVVRADSNLELSGLRIEPRGSKSNRPLMSAFGDCSVIDVWWVCRDGHEAPGTAIRAGTRRLTLTDSWFHGFPTAIDAQFLPETTIELNRCLLTSSGSNQTGKRKSGWTAPALVNLEFPQWNVDRASLKLIRCTFFGANLFQVSGPNKAPKITISAEQNLFEGTDLFVMGPGRDASTRSFRWSGGNNLFDISGRYWPSFGETEACASLEAWEATASEKDSSSRRVPLTNPNASIPKPADFSPRFTADKEFGFHSSLPSTNVGQSH